MLRFVAGMIAAALTASGCGSGPVVDGVELDNSTWVASTVAERPPPLDHRPTLVFANGGVTGWAGCNSYGATSVSVSGNDLSLSGLGMTAMACTGPDGSMDNPVMNTEGEFFRALQGANRIEIRAGRLVVSGATGEVVFDRVTGQSASAR